MSRPRWLLHAQATTWRKLMGTGMFLHKLAPPHPPQPSYRLTIPTTVSPVKGEIELLIYCPPGYRKPAPGGGSTTSGAGYPVLVNFHGGGFTLGDPADDVRWFMSVMEHCNAICISVGYRLAPEFPFPTAVEDGTDALLWVGDRDVARAWGWDCERMAVSGFSAGGNMAFSAVLRLREEVLRRWGRGFQPQPQADPGAPTATESTIPEVEIHRRDSLLVSGEDLLKTEFHGKLVGIVAWYPSTDFTLPRATRRSTNLRSKDKELPTFFTDLFDASYLYPPKSIAMDNPYLSPGVAPVEMLKTLPEDIVMITCEWDELLAEAERFKKRLEGEVGKRVCYWKVEGTMHGWDKSPNPVWRDPMRDGVYANACVELGRIWGVGGSKVGGSGMEEKDVVRESLVEKPVVVAPVPGAVPAGTQPSQAPS